MKRLSLGMIAAGFVLAGILGATNSAAAQKRGSFRSDYLKNDAKFLRVFRPIVEKIQPSTVAILEKGEATPTALGTVVDEHLILTKSSKTADNPVVRFADSREVSAKVLGRNKDHDLALLQIEGEKLTPVIFRPSKEAPVGTWAISVGMDTDPVALGVVSVALRKVRPSNIVQFVNKAFLGVGLSPAEVGAQIDRIVPRTAAARAGLQVRDIILEIAGKKITTPDTVSKTLIPYKPGDSVKIRIRRGEKELEVNARLGKRPQSRGELQNNMGSKLSERRTGFPVILQHDSVVKPHQCGGPLVDLDGKVIGINISRAGRTESYAIPTEVVLPLIGELRAGKDRVSSNKKPNS